MSTSWVPSHVQLTVHQARDLLLKSKSSTSEVYVSVQVEREKCCSGFLPRETNPQWNYTTKIPLMSLDTTLHCTVRQKTTITDKFLGLISVPLSGFSLSSKPVTHWYKLGPRPGKTSSKLRGELLITIKFLSNWVAEETDSIDCVFIPNGHSDTLKGLNLANSSPLIRRGRRMLKRSKSDLKMKPKEGGDVGSEGGGGGGGGGGKGGGEKAAEAAKVKEMLGIFRRSLRKKNHSPVLESCDDEFTLSSLSLSHKATSPKSKSSSPSLPHAKQHSPQSDSDLDSKLSISESLSRTLDPKYIPNGRGVESDRIGGGGNEWAGSERVATSVSPVGDHSGVQLRRHREATGEGVGEGENEEEEEEGPGRGDKETQTEMSAAMKYHNFRKKKRPWSMHTIPPIPTALQPDSPHTEVKGDSAITEQVDQSNSQHPQKSEEHETEVVTFRARSNSLARKSHLKRNRPRSYSVNTDGHRQSRPGSVDQDSSESCSESASNTPTHSPLLNKSRAFSGLRSSEHSRRSGMSNVANSHHLPSSLRNRSQSFSETGVEGRVAGQQNTDTQQPMKSPVSRGEGSSQPRSLRLNPRVPLGMSHTDSPVLSRSSASRRALNFSGDLPPRASPRGNIHRNPSPIQLDPPLVEEEEEREGEGGGVKVEGGSGGSEAEKRGHTSEGDSKREMVSSESTEQAMKSRVSPEGETATFQVDAKELQISLDPRPELLVPAPDPPNPARQKTPPSVSSSSASSTGAQRSLGKSPAKGRKLPAEPNTKVGKPAQRSPSMPNSIGSTPSRRGSRGSRKLPDIPPSCSPGPTLGSQSSGRAQSTSPIASHGSESPGSSTASRSPSSSVASLSSSLVVGSSQRGELEGGLTSSMTLPRKNKHTVAFRENSPRGFEAIPALPPSLTELRSQTLPRHAKLSRSFSEMDRPLSSLAGATSKDRSPLNVRAFDRRVFNNPQSPKKPDLKISTGVDETDSPADTQMRSVTPELPRARPSTPQHLTQSYPGTPVPQDRVKRGGGLQKAMVLYQENRRKTKSVRRSLDESGKSWSARRSSVQGSLPMLSADLGSIDRMCVSAGNSPQLQRRATTHLDVPRNQPEKARGNPFSNLRRTQSSRTSYSQQPRRTKVDVSTLQGSTPPNDSSGRASASGSWLDVHITPPLIEEVGKSETEENGGSSGSGNTDMAGPSGAVESSASQKPDCKKHLSLEVASTNSNSNNERDSHSVTTPTSLTSDTDSIKTSGSERTLVEGSSSSAALPLRNDRLNLSPTKHKHTPSSLDSEGLGSLTSEEISMEDPDWTQWSKEDLVIELLQTKRKLKSTEEELKAVRGYLDNLLLRIMETNPTILSVGNL